LGLAAIVKMDKRMKPGFKIVRVVSIAFILALLLGNLPSGAAGRFQLASGRFSAAYAQDTSGSILSVVPVWSTEGDQVSAEYGFAVGTAGDVNRDGYGDIIVGAAKYEKDIYREGAAFVYHGSAQGVSDVPDWTAGSGLSGARFGNSVGYAGDVNGDGYADVIIGANRYNNENSEEGAAYVFHGSASGLGDTAAWMVESNLTRAEFGYAVSTAGDINHDGYDDVVVGARYYSQPEDNEGAVFVYLGSATGLHTTADWIYESNQSGAGLGTSVASAGDVNGDGFDDILVGAPFHSAAINRAGAAFVFLGAADGLDAARSWQIDGTQEDARFAVSVGSAGDVNQDGLGDWIIGAMLYDAAQVNEGAAFIYLGTVQDLPSKPYRMVTSGQPDCGFGVSVGTVGDVNQDGYPELFVGAHLYTDDQTNEGIVFVYRGGYAGPTQPANWWSGGDKADTYYGYSASTAGDTNGDGKDDLLVGAPLYKHDLRTVMGRAFLYLGEAASPELSVRLFLPLLERPGVLP
jgi:hypothetical protein